MFPIASHWHRSGALSIAIISRNKVLESGCLVYHKSLSNPIHCSRTISKSRRILTLRYIIIIIIIIIIIMLIVIVKPNLLLNKTVNYFQRSERGIKCTAAPNRSQERCKTVRPDARKRHIPRQLSRKYQALPCGLYRDIHRLVAGDLCACVQSPTRSNTIDRFFHSFSRGLDDCDHILTLEKLTKDINQDGTR